MTFLYQLSSYFLFCVFPYLMLLFNSGAQPPPSINTIRALLQQKLSRQLHAGLGRWKSCQRSFAKGPPPCSHFDTMLKGRPQS